MRLRRPSRLTVLTAALLVLLPTLAVLQYRWVGQLSAAEHDRMQRNMRTAAAQFRDGFDHEVARAFISLQVDAAIVREEAWDRYAERYGAWASTTASPALVADVFLVDAAASQEAAYENTSQRRPELQGRRPELQFRHDSQVRLRRWNASLRRFEPAAWEGPLAAARAHFQQELTAFTAGRGNPPPQRPAFDDESLLVAPLLNVQIGPPSSHEPIVTIFGCTIVRLNMAFIRDELLPTLARRHFTHTDGAEYRVAVVDTKNPARLIYKSSPDAPSDPARADVAEPMFAAGHDAMMFLARGAIRQSGAPPGARETRRNLVVSVIRSQGDESTIQTRIFNSEVGRWKVLLQHERGSLEAAVGAVRQRNLILSFGVLLLTGVSMGLLSLSSRRAQTLARQQMEFVAGVSHELRTPVAVIRSAAENLSQGVVGDPDRVRRYGDTIQAEARRLGEMVERVLQFAGTESGRPLAGTFVSVERIVAEAIEGAKAEAGSCIERHIAPDLPPILGDAGALRSAIQNLITNAVKYGGADRWVGVRAESSPAGSGREVRIIVEDHGAGVAAADLPHIFDPFYRGSDAIARQIQGSGLGLALVKRIVEAHRGRVSVACREGVGSAFTIHLPAARPTADVPESTPTREAESRGEGLAPRPSES